MLKIVPFVLLNSVSRYDYFCKDSCSFYFYCDYYYMWPDCHVNVWMHILSVFGMMKATVRLHIAKWQTECSPLHDTSCSQGGWISPVCTRHFGLQEKGRGIEPGVQVKANTITLISHGECCSCMCVTHTISHSHSLVFQWLIATPSPPSLPRFMTFVGYDPLENYRLCVQGIIKTGEDMAKSQYSWLFVIRIRDNLS